MNYLDLIITGEKVYLKVVSMDYVETIFNEFNESIITYMYPEVAKHINETIEFINLSRKKAEDGKDYTYMILNKETHEFLGCGGVHHLDNDCPELGIWIKKSAHGHHYGRDAVTASFNYFKKYYKKFLYPVDQRNQPSRKIALSLGGVLEKVI